MCIRDRHILLLLEFVLVSNPRYEHPTVCGWERKSNTILLYSIFHRKMVSSNCAQFVLICTSNLKSFALSFSRYRYYGWNVGTVPPPPRPHIFRLNQWVEVSPLSSIANIGLGMKCIWNQFYVSCSIQLILLHTLIIGTGYIHMCPLHIRVSQWCFTTTLHRICLFQKLHFIQLHDRANFFTMS